MRERGSALRVAGLLALLLVGNSRSQGAGDHRAAFDAFLAVYRAAESEARQEVARSFVERQQARGGFPIVEADGNVVFVYLGQGHEKDVRLIGDFRTRSFYSVYWDEAGEAMERAVEGGGLFFRRIRFERGARLDYKLVVDGQAQCDPLNPRVVETGIVGTASELAMPGYEAPKEAITRDDVPKGRLHVVDEPWAHPKVTIYLPARYDQSQRHPVVYTADGTVWIDLLKLPTILDNLIAAGVVAPLMAVMIDPAADRGSWYQFNPEYIAYLERVVRYVDAHYSTITRAEGRLHVGTSAGGRVALYAGLERPSLFRNVAMLSPSLVGSPHYYEPYFSRRRRPPFDLRLWLSAGSYEGYIRADARAMERYFASVGLKPKVVYTHDGHSFGAWRRLIAGMLEHFLPAPGRMPASP